jgi:hypothetical protein
MILLEAYIGFTILKHSVCKLVFKSGTKSMLVRHEYERHLPENPSSGLCLTVPLGEELSCKIVVNIDILPKRKEKPMFVVAIVICLLVFALIAGADLLISNITSDELSNMGIERKP